MDAKSLKEKFLSQLSEGIKDKLSKLHLSFVDEGIESLLKGKTTIEGRAPETEQEWCGALGIYVVSAIAAYEGMIKGVKDAYPNEALNINVNYRGETYEHHVEPPPAQNPDPYYGPEAVAGAWNTLNQ